MKEILLLLNESSGVFQIGILLAVAWNANELRHVNRRLRALEFFVYPDKKE